jgi:hypothetical protein
MVKILQAAAHGLEISFANNGSGGLASVFHLLEIAHTHYWAKDPGDSSTSEQESQVIINIGSMTLIYILSLAYMILFIDV